MQSILLLKCINYLRYFIIFLPTECVIEYKINEAAADFLHMQGVLKNSDLKNYKEDAEMVEKSAVSTSLPELFKHNRRSRRSDQNDVRPCCCTPAKHLVPTFITDNKFDDILETFTLDKH